MPVNLIEYSFVKGPSGTLLRFTLEVALTAKHVMSVAGCLASRGPVGELVVLPPAIQFQKGGKRLTYRNCRFSEELAADLSRHIESAFGANIVRANVARGDSILADTPGFVSGGAKRSSKRAKRV